MRIKIKIFITVLIISFICLMNKAMAANWMPVKADNGRVAEINISSFKKNGSLIEYEIKQNRLDDEIIYKMITDYDSKSTAILNMSIYNDGKQVGFEDFSKHIKYNKIKEAKQAAKELAPEYNAVQSLSERKGSCLCNTCY